MLARGVLCRVAADVPKTSTHDVPQLAHLLQRTLSTRNARPLPALAALSRACYAVLADARRSYATTARATKPTRTVKKDVKKAVAKKPTPKKKAVAKKPAPKKKVVAKKAKPKKKAVAKPKVGRGSGRGRGRPKKVLTPEEVEKNTIRELKQKALVEAPKKSTYRALDVLLKESMSGVKNIEESKKTLTESSAKYRTLTPAEREHYNHLANEASAASAKACDDWVRSHTPTEIRVANNARAQLKTKLAGKYKRMPAYTRPIPDERHVKRPLSSYARFLRDRWASGDMKSMSVGESGKLISNEWKALSAGEKKKYEDEFKADHDRYIVEFKRTYGRDSEAA